MITYKYTDSTNTVVHVIDGDGISRSSMLISALPESTEILPADLPDHRLAILSQIEELEASITQRRLREALLTGDTSFIDSVDAQIAALRAQL